MKALAVGGLPLSGGSEKGARVKSRALFFSAPMVPVAEHSPPFERIAFMDRRRKAANDNERRYDRRGPRHVSLEERLLAELSYGYAT